MRFSIATRVVLAFGMKWGFQSAYSKSTRAPDAGILSRKKKKNPISRGEEKELCPTGFVECVHGMSEGITCKQACDGKCCVSGDSTDAFDRACNDFNGKVCKDNVSCTGDGSCSGAVIGTVINGCIGEDSCNKARGIGLIYNGCSCEGDEFNSCEACRYSPEFESNAYIQEIVNSCQGREACNYIGSVGSMKDSCLGAEACYFLAYAHGSIGRMRSSCTTSRSCEYTAWGGYIALMENSCLAEESCRHAVSTFHEAASCYQYEIYDCNVGAIVDCCLTAGECEEIIPDTIPDQCRSPLDLVNLKPSKGIRLGRCQGNCDSDKQCLGELVCFKSDGTGVVPGCSGDAADRNYCTDRPSPTYLMYVGETGPFPLSLCKGDCDNDSDCAGGLYCYDEGGRNGQVPGCDGLGWRKKNYCTDTQVLN